MFKFSQFSQLSLDTSCSFHPHSNTVIRFLFLPPFCFYSAFIVNQEFNLKKTIKTPTHRRLTVSSAKIENGELRSYTLK